MPTTTHGGPYPASTAPNNIPGDLKLLAEWTDDQLQVLVGLLAAQATPAGATMAWDDTNAPPGWHVRDGRAVSRVDNPVLFARYGVSQGAGNGSTTFNLPNDKGRALVGLDTGQAEFNTIRKTGGSRTHTLSVAESPQHDHGGSTGNGSGGYYGIPTILTGIGGYGLSLVNSFVNRVLVGNNELSEATHAHPISPQGGGQPHNNLQPYAVTNWIIKAG